jgi:hypothetical protein
VGREGGIFQGSGKNFVVTGKPVCYDLAFPGLLEQSNFILATLGSF